MLYLSSVVIINKMFNGVVNLIPLTLVILTMSFVLFMGMRILKRLFISDDFSNFLNDKSEEFIDEKKNGGIERI